MRGATDTNASILILIIISIMIIIRCLTLILILRLMANRRGACRARRNTPAGVRSLPSTRGKIMYE